jgi:hypothetical protein
LATADLLPGLDHRSEAVRRITANLLRKRGALSVEAAQRMLSDSNANVRFEAIQSLEGHGKAFSLSDAKTALVKPTRSGLAGSRDDSEGEACFAKWEDDHFAKMPLAELEREASKGTIFDREPYFALVRRAFEAKGAELRASIDDQFRKDFKEGLEALGRLLGTGETYQKTRSLDEWMRKELTRKGLDVLTKMSLPEDLPRVREALASGFVSYSDGDVAFLRKHGEWEDIPLIVASVERTLYTSLLGWQNDSKYEAAARAIYAMGRARFPELLSLKMPKRLLRTLLAVASDKHIKALSDDAIIALLLADDDNVRKIAALKSVRALPKARLRKLLEAYLANDAFRYYNVIHWLDLGLSLPRSLALQTAARVIAKDG